MERKKQKNKRGGKEDGQKRQKRGGVETDKRFK